MGNGGTLLSTIGTLLALAAGLRWMFARIDRYQARIEQRLTDVENKYDRCQRSSSALLSAYQLVAEAVRRHDPLSPELDRAERLLALAFQMEGEPIPREWEMLLRRLGEWRPGGAGGGPPGRGEAGASGGVKPGTGNSDP